MQQNDHNGNPVLTHVLKPYRSQNFPRCSPEFVLLVLQQLGPWTHGLLGQHLTDFGAARLLRLVVTVLGVEE